MITLKVVPVPGIPRVHSVPFPVTHKDGATVTVELDDENGTPFRLVFQPFQALRVTTVDCFDVPDGFVPKTVVEVKESPWVQELTEVLWHHDHSATFMQKAHHFLIPAYDDMIEVIAWNVSVEFIDVPKDSGQ